ncbi:MAG TPA: HNH endonuclease [Blastocatellia bacterium]|nr:HNH endonuclease [Blastocatellia bacterium]HMV84938.1 HNH endonuclease [Blastocatellia bacterium]HMX25949.1 HNH endonuclease [Blastocatellia bacterium]HMY72669.1 HNH endonuclease [Blastocatellia bacterium]HMZ16891.1 HNH endonuclease [Blastocatellia bacterium]
MALTRKVLLLNASYEPLNLVSAPKALTLVIRRVAEVLEIDKGRVLRSPRFVFDVPSVIRLTQYIDVRSRQNRVTNRHRILARDHYRCQYCGKRGTAFELTLDHILPRSRGGRTVAENLVAACQACNNRKGDRTPEEARMPLLTNPAALFYGLERAELRLASNARPEWKKYLFLEHAEEERAALTA